MRTTQTQTQTTTLARERARTGTRARATADYLTARSKVGQGILDTAGVWLVRYRKAWGLGEHWTEAAIEQHALRVSAGKRIADGRERTERRGGGYWGSDRTWHSR